MKSFRSKVLLLILTFSCGGLSLTAKTVVEAFEEANQAYTRGDSLLKESSNPKAAKNEFLAALNLYKTCLKKAESPELHRNLGNTYFKLGKTGYSIFHFRQALQLQPSSEEIRTNLELARKTAKLPKNKKSLYEKTLAKKSPHFWKWILAITFWLGVGTLLLPKYFRIQGPIPSTLGIIFLLFSLIPLWAIIQSGKVRTVGIILEQDAPLLISPTPESEVANYLQPGQEVQLNLDPQSKTHIYAHTESGDSGWLPNQFVGHIHP